VESFLHGLGEHLRQMILNSYFQLFAVTIVVLHLRERAFRKFIVKAANDLEQVNDQWLSVIDKLKKSHEAEKQQMIADFHEQVRAIRDAENVVWVKVEPEVGESSFAVSKRKPRH
jgi:archaellum biogenesis ATPase FlaH